jgi:hypothetical protein
MAKLARILDSQISDAARPSRSAILAACDAEIRKTLGNSVRNSRKSREQICDVMSASLGVKVSIHMLNCWIAPGRSNARFPLCFLHAFCAATCDERLRRFALGPEMSGLVELGEIVSRLLGEKCKTLQILRSGRRPRNGRDGGAAAVHEHA